VRSWKASTTCHSQWKHRFLSKHFYSIIHKSLDAIIIWTTDTVAKQTTNKHTILDTQALYGLTISGEHVYKNTVPAPSKERTALYSPVVTLCTVSLTLANSTFCPHSVCMCFVWIWEQTAIISLYSVKWLAFRRVRKIAKSDY
jgi:hypothetical protein